MEYLCSLMLLALNLYNYEFGLNKVLFLAAGATLFFAVFYFSFLKSRSFMGACLSAMCHTWAISWMNIFGGSAEGLQISWFYLVGVLILGYFITNITRFTNVHVSPLVLGLFGFVAILSVYPIFLSPSIKEALKEFIMIGFFLVMVFISLFISESFSNEVRERVINAYIFAVFVTSILLIFQYFYYNATGDVIFKFSIGNYFGKPMVSSKLLMEDTSSSTIMMAAGVFYMLERINRKEKRLMYFSLIVITVMGLAFTTRRTSILSLAVCLVIYVLVTYKDIGKKILMAFLMLCAVVVMLSYLAFARSIEDMSGLLNLNGRAENFMNSLGLFLRYPFGIGYDNQYLESFIVVIPHNTFLRWLNMCGIILAPSMLFIIIYVIYTAAKKKRTDDFWVLACCFLAMNFIPDILNARFLVVPCMLALVSKPKNKEDKQNIKVEYGVSHRKSRILKESSR